MLDFFINLFGIIPMSMSISLLIIAVTILMWTLGWRWEKNLKIPKGYPEKTAPKVSVVIASYKSAKTIRETVESVMNSDYKKKEIIVVDDTPDDSVVEALKGLDVKIIRHKKRIGKAKSMNLALKGIRTDLFMFLDSDSIIDSKFISRLVPWFGDRKVGAVSPKYNTRNRNGLLGRFTSLEASFWFTLARTHMFFGSMVSFRGCGIMVRESAFRKVGMWDETLVEDMALAGKLLTYGYKIAHDPKATVYTDEPETWKELYRQRFRWGKGGFFAFVRNIRTYIKAPQIVFGMLPHALLLVAMFLFIMRNSLLALLVIWPLYELSALTPIILIELGTVLGLLFSVYWIPAALATFVNSVLFSFRGMKGLGEIALLIPYVLIFLPVLFGIYALGILAGIKERIKYGPEVDEMNFKDWKK
ncbi:MAG: glycosyltransferase family 2 protein [Candidatus Aenigmarchaeota archaeon]|nr:glycosyltransferase family 2 protein [Candidatus Aenigmarchaeota archaeon]